MDWTSLGLHSMEAMARSNGTLPSSIVIDTIADVATDQSGLTATPKKSRDCGPSPTSSNVPRAMEQADVRQGVQLSLEQAHRRTRPHCLHRHPNLDRYQSRSMKVGIRRTVLRH
jgi:hypothetical protein